MKYKNITIDQSKDTAFALILIMILLNLYLKSPVYLYITLGLSMISMIYPIFFKPLGFLWFGFAHVAGNIVSKVLLSIVFFIIITPLKWIIKLCGVDSMRLKSWKNGQDSAFVVRDHLFSKQDIEKPY